MFVGWEGVGLCSYLLIGFWYQKKSASDAGKKAFIVNRIGDWGFILGVLLIFVRFGSLDFQEVARTAAALSPEGAFGTMSVITLLLFVGATGKSAQIPLYVWLPDAMEGPTPVSALIHAATMVTAGVYMIGRNAVLFSHAPATLTIVAIVGTATALVAGTIGLVQNDIKRVLAYSTVSQLGYMFLAMGVGAFGAGIFHLYTHAFFKALLFLGSGAVIHALSGEQDMRRMGGLKKDLPITYWTFVIGAVAIAGIPPFAGFFSKDEILFKTYTSGHMLLWVVGILTAMLTATYMFRLVFMTFHGERASLASAAGHAAPSDHVDHSGHSDPSDLKHGTHLHDAPPAMAVALVVLALGSVVAGWAGIGGRFEHFLEPSFGPVIGVAGEAAEGGPETALMILSVIVAVAGIGIAAYFFLKNRQAADRVAAQFPGVHGLLSNKYYVDEVYDAAVVQPIYIISEDGLWKGVDAGVIDRTVNGVAGAVGSSGEVLRRLQTGSVRAYAASLFLGVVLILGYYLWP
jgi:NADH-quinone oxidoreductase subunit L